MTLTDTHCHLDNGRFDPDREAVLERASKAGVDRLLVPGIDSWTSRAAVELAESHPGLYAAVGLHPEEASPVERSKMKEYRELAQHPKVRAIGEIGLDYYWNASSAPLQKELLVEQLQLAQELSLPVVIHFREKGDAPDGDCASDLFNILETWTAGLRRENNPIALRPGVLHSFSGNAASARRAIDLHFYLGVTGPVTHREDRQKLVAGLPLGSLLIETDAPYMAPVPQRGRRNEPAFVRHIADKIAVLQSCSIEAVELATTTNAARLFVWE